MKHFWRYTMLMIIGPLAPVSGISVKSVSWNFIRLSTLSTVYQALEQEGLSAAAWYPGSSSSSFGIVSMDFGYWPQESKMQSNVAENHTRAPAQNLPSHIYISLPDNIHCSKTTPVWIVTNCNTNIVVRSYFWRTVFIHLFSWNICLVKKCWSMQ